MAERFGNDLILLERIAAGGMAEVYRAKQLGLSGFQKTIAVKRILPNYAANEEFKSMFRAEANLSAMLAHQNVVQIFSNGEFNDYLFLTMEFVDGKNVRQVLARADKKKIRIPIENALYIVGEAAKGLDYAHNFVDEKTGKPLEIVHRDMSPQNIMLSYDGAVKIVDFGIAKAAARSGQTKAGVLKGKFGYMSPEQAQGMNLDRRTDVFAIGIILFELLTQRRLFTSDDDLKTLQLVKNCRVPRPSKYNPDVTPTLDNIVLKALSREKAERYSNASELYVDLHRYLAQKYPKFLSTDLAAFLRDLFAEDIVEEKKKREKANAEIPSIEGAWNSERSATPRAVVTTQNASQPPDSNLQESALQSEKTGVDNFPVDTTQATQSISEKSLLGNGETSTPGTALPPPKFGSSEFLDLSKSGANASQFRLQDSGLRNTPPPPAKSSYDSEALRAQLKRGSKVTAPARGRSLLGRGGMVAALVLFVLGLYSYLEPQTPSRNPGSTNGAQVVDESRECPLNLVFDEKLGRCVVSAQPAVTCASPEVLNPATNRCEAPASVASKPEQIATESFSAPQPKVVDAKKVFVWKGEEFSPSGVLNLNSTPRAKKIIINGRVLVDKDLNPLSTPVTGLRLKPGNYLIRLENDFFGWSREQRITIENSRTRDLDLANQ